MPEYRYRAMLRDGRIIRNVVTAKSKREAFQKLKATKILPIEIKLRKSVKLPKSQKLNQAQIKAIQLDYNKRESHKKRVQKMRLEGPAYSRCKIWCYS